MALYLGTNNGVFVSLEGYVLQDSNGVSLIALPMADTRKIIINNIVYRLNVELSEKEGE